ncbi:hypothetical protein FGM00_07535 [Aggregatimonas sangjinii]|uniref:Uncharacterized protein n=1 Tax=Aggregatimonas sangjinii TaxID=2583587 RepID=A0A5B7SSH0_9FLAO|nr:hypothetical protein [Aggregatimonas sangjinii]QCW99957.1 hypothetical protein FGM00_07535 [Aggregatimonas sangjinii]
MNCFVTYEIITDDVKSVLLKENIMKIAMRIPRNKLLGLVVVLLAAMQLSAQQTAPENSKKEVDVQRHTVMEQFASEDLFTLEERKQKRLAHLAEIEKLKKALDTMDISRRKKRKILADLINKPYSDRVNQAMAEINFEEGDEIIKD